jgi:hypothetical protein
MAASLGDRPIDVVAGQRPANQFAAGDAVDSEGTRKRPLGLIGVRSQDLEVCPRAKRKQRVVCAKTDVPAASLGTNAEPAFQISDGSSKVGGGVDEVVNLHVNLTSRK